MLSTKLNRKQRVARDCHSRLKEPDRDVFIQKILCKCFAENWLSSAQLEAYSPKQVIFKPDRHSECMYFLLAGAAKLSRFRGSGEEYAVALMPKNSIFGAFPFLDSVNSTHSGQAVALAPSILLSVEVEQIERILIDNPDIAGALLQCLALSNLESKWFMEVLATKRASARLERFLVLLCQHFGVSRAKDVLIELALTHQDIAQLIGGARETLSKELGRLRDSGCISIDRGRIVVHQLEQLLERYEFEDMHWNESAMTLAT